jgi:hypothetical protein
MTTVETRVLNPVNRASVDSVPVTGGELVDAAMSHEEDQMSVDEEISSSEGLDLENHMMTVVLVKSAVDASPTGDKDSPSSRYGLRKRRRPGDIASGELVEVTPQPAQGPGEQPGDDNIVPESAVLGEAEMKFEQVQQQTPKLQQLAIPPTHKPAAQSADIPRHQPLTIKEDPGSSKGIKIKDHPILGRLQANVAPTPGTMARPLIPPTKPVPTAMTYNPAAPKRKVKRPMNAEGPALKQELLPTSGAVPNPLSQANVTPSTIPRPYAPRQTGAPRARPAATSVPCPLPPSVPCPLQPDSTVAPVEKKKVTISEPPATPRTRIFSVDLDREYCCSKNCCSILTVHAIKD